MPPQLNEPVLLTGAGFTHNFGGYLARTMWAQIFNSREIQTCPQLANLLRENLDYESAYTAVIYGDFTEADKAAFTRAVSDAYAQMDAVLRDLAFRPGVPYPVDITRLSRFLDRFAGQGNSRGYFFTLNQDLLVERWHHGDQIPITPGLPQLRFPPNPTRPLTREDLRTLPDGEQVGRVRRDDEAHAGASGRFHYVKLHGSHNWHSHAGGEAMVIGGNKPEQIDREPLLRWYLELFQRVLFLPRRRLLVCGYGFRDPHMNRIIARAMAESGLEVHVVTPGDHGEFRERMRAVAEGEVIWQGLASYFPYALRDVFPLGEGETEAARQIRRAIFR